MSSDSTSEDTSAASDTPVNLGNVFIHPAGLPTPRYLVEALVRDAERSAKGIASSQAHKISFPVTRPMSRPGNPLATDLKEILAFSEPQISMSDQRNAGTKGFDSSEDIGASERSKAIPWNQTETGLFRSNYHLN
jgi:hypothetical protein